MDELAVKVQEMPVEESPSRIVLPRPEIAYLPLSKLVIDEDYQRDFKAAWANWLADNWDDAIAGLLRVSERPGGIFAVLAGQHRRAALLQLEVESWWCEIFRGLTPMEEAKIFSGGQDVRRMHILDEFKAHVAAQKPYAVEIMNAVRENEFRIAFTSKSGHKGEIVAIDALKKVERWGVLNEALMTIRSFWPIIESDEEEMRAAVSRNFLLGVGGMIRGYGAHPHFSFREAKERLNQFTPQIWLSKADRVAAAITSTSIWHGLMYGFIQTMNKHKSTRALPLPTFSPAEMRAWNIK